MPSLPGMGRDDLNGSVALFDERRLDRGHDFCQWPACLIALAGMGAPGPSVRG